MPEPKTDTVRRYDYLGTVHTDPTRTDGVLATRDPDTGFLHADARISRTGLQTYGDAEGNTWVEYRDESEVFSDASLASFEGVVLTNEHPSDFVTTKNVKDVQIGALKGKPVRDGIYARVPIVITDEASIRGAQSGEGIELSCGYTANVIRESGMTADGMRFDARQTEIRGNHVARVPRGRAGPECRILMRGDAYQTEEGKPMFKIKTSKGVEHEVSKEVYDMHHETLAALETGKADKDRADKAEAELAAKADAFPPKEEEEEDKDKAKGDVALRAELDSLRAQSKAREDGESARIDARVALVADARQVIGDTCTVNGVSDSELMRQIVLSVTPSLSAKLDAEKGNPGYLRCAYDSAVAEHTRRKGHVDHAERSVLDAIGGESKTTFADSFQSYADSHSRTPHEDWLKSQKGGN